MAVVDVKQKWTGRENEFAAESGETHTSAWTVLLDGTDSIDYAPRVARLAPGIPRVGDPASFDFFVRCRRVGARPLSMLLWEVTAYYSLPSWGTGETGEGSSDPLSQPPKVRWSSLTINEPIDEDRDGQPLVNVVEEGFDPPLTRDYIDVVLEYEVNQTTFNYAAAIALSNAVNSTSFLGFAPGVARLTDWHAEHNLEGDHSYWRVGIRVQFRNGGWKKRVLNRGFRTWEGEYEDDGSKKYVNVTDGNGNPVQEPVLLTLVGQRVDDPGNATWLEFDVYPEGDFSDLIDL